MDWQAMGLAHLSPFQHCFVIGKPAPTPKKRYDKHPALKGRDYTSASALCTTKEERTELKHKFISDYILRVNKCVDLAAHGGQTKGQKAPR